MWTDDDLLGEPRSVAAYDYIRSSHARMLPSSRLAASRRADANRFVQVETVTNVPSFSGCNLGTAS